MIENKITMYEFLKNSLTKNNYLNNKELLYFEGKEIRVKELLEYIDIVAYNIRKMGVKKGDTVTFNLPNSITAIIVFYAVNKCGAVANIVHPKEPVHKIFNTIDATQSKLFITYYMFYDEYRKEIDDKDVNTIVCKLSDFMPFIKKIAFGKTQENGVINHQTFKDLLKINENYDFSVEYNHVAAYLHSSGTTGVSKTVKLSNESFNNLVDCLRNVIDNMDAEHNRCVSVLPLFHGFGLGVSMHAMLSFGFELVVIPKFNPKKFCNVVGKKKGTICVGVPYMYEKLYKLDDKYFKKLQTLENTFVGGDKLSYELKSVFDKRLYEITSSAELLEGYGLTETVTVASINRKNDYTENSVGYALDNIKFFVIDENNEILSKNIQGEICIGGPTLMDGYLENDDSVFVTLDNIKCVKTGDFGYIDDSNKIIFIDRKKRIFKISGITVFPSEIESASKKTGLVKNSLAVYVQSSIILYVEIVENVDKEEAKTRVYKYLKENLSSYSLPKEIIVLDEWPRNMVGKSDVNKITKMTK